MKARNMMPGGACRRLALAALLGCAALIGLGAQETQTRNRSMTSLRGGYVQDLQGYGGWMLDLRSGSFIESSPFYWGFGSTTGGLVESQESLFETCLVLGAWFPVLGPDLGLDLNLDLVAFGGRVNGATLLFQAETPGLRPGLSVVFPMGWDLDFSLGAWALVRPYNPVSGAWDFQRSYWEASFSVEIKSNLLVRKQAWSSTEE